MGIVLVKLPTDWSHSSVSCGILPHFPGNESMVFAVFCWCFITEVWLPNVQRFLWTNPLWAKSGKVGGERFDHVKVRFFIGETTRRFFVMCCFGQERKGYLDLREFIGFFRMVEDSQNARGKKCCPTCAFVGVSDIHEIVFRYSWGDSPSSVRLP